MMHSCTFEAIPPPSWSYAPLASNSAAQEMNVFDTVLPNNIEISAVYLLPMATEPKRSVKYKVN